MNRNLIISLILIFLIAGIGIINFTGVDLFYLNWLEKGVFNLVSPIIEFFTGFYHSVTSYWDGLMHASVITVEKENLERKIAELERENLILQQFRRENIRLRELLAFKNFVSFKTEGAKVVGYSPSNWRDKLIIDKGAEDGIKVKMPIISYNGMLIGRVDYVGAFSSQVTLVNDPEFVVGGIVQREESRAIGLVKGQLDERNHDIMDKIPWDADIKEGDLILTSGLSNSYPKGLPIGKVVKVESDNYGLSQKAKVQLFISNRTIEEVLVIKDF